MLSLKRWVAFTVEQEAGSGGVWYKLSSEYKEGWFEQPQGQIRQVINDAALI